MMKRSPGEAARAILGIIAPAGNGRGMGRMGGESESEDEGEDLGTAALGAAASELIDAVKKGDRWVVKSKSDAGNSPHGGGAPGGAMPPGGAAMPPGHPPTGGGAAPKAEGAKG